MGIRIREGDVRVVLSQLEANSYDGCLTDPPYGLTADKQGGTGTASLNPDSPAGRSRIGTGFMGMGWDAGVPNAHTWRHVYRVLKPGAFLLAFGGTRTHHRLMCAIEDAGFEIRDCVMWLYGSGFPKSMNIGKKLEAFNGYGTALKPAWEPIIVAMKPLDGGYASNALKHGVAGINIDAGRIVGHNPSVDRRNTARRTGTTPGHPGEYSHTIKDRRTPEAYCAEHAGESLGRWPANVILDEESAAILDTQSGLLHSCELRPDMHVRANTGWSGGSQADRVKHTFEANSGGASRFFYTAKASYKERNSHIDSPQRKVNDGRKTEIDNAYQRGESLRYNTHPTVKPVKLTEYLAKLILPPYQGKPRRLLLPFCGSGSEIIGAMNAGWKNCLGIESDPEYAAIARDRCARPRTLF